MSVVQVKIVYSYYSAERVTPIFLKEEELLGLSYEAFKWKIVNEIPHLTTDMDMSRLTVLDEGYQVDISPAYFQHQIKGILEKHATKAIEVKALVFQSPGVASPPRKEINTSNVALSSPVSKKKLPCRSLNMVLKQSLIESGSENTQQTRNPPTCLPNYHPSSYHGAYMPPFSPGMMMVPPLRLHAPFQPQINPSPHEARAPNENIVQTHLNKALLNVF